MVSFGKALALPFQSIRKLLIGALLYAIPFVNIVTGLFVYGYALKVAKHAMRREFVLPDWGRDGRDLLISGLLATAIGVIWMIPALIILIFSLVGAGLGAASVGGGLTGLVVALAVSGIALLFTWYVLPSAVLNYASHNKFGKAFEFRTIFSKAFSAPYFAGWLLAFVVAIVVTLLGFALILLLAAALPDSTVFSIVAAILAWAINGFVAFIELVIMFALYGESWAKA